MAFDGLALAALTDELSEALTGGRISKIAMPEKDELLITIKNSETYRLLISAGASLPLMYLTDENRPSPASAPAFCMLLRKHIGTARITGITQRGLERIIEIGLEHYNDLGDLCTKKLVVELMGKYSNIIFCDDSDTILDSIKRIPSTVSSLREVLPGRKYYIPDELRKIPPLDITAVGFHQCIKTSHESVCKALSVLFEGISPCIAAEICFRAAIDPDIPYSCLDQTEKEALYYSFHDIISKIKEASYEPCMIVSTNNDIPVEFSAIALRCYEAGQYKQISYNSMSRLLRDFFSSKEIQTRIRQKSSDLRRLTVTALERASKKYDLQEKQLKDCKGKDKYKIYGDLLNTYGYSLKGGEKSFTCENYYDADKSITIPLDEHRSASENAKRFYDRYAKLRRTEAVLSEEIKKTESDIDHLSSIVTALDIAVSEGELSQIKDELTEYGYIKRHNSKAQPSHGKKHSSTAQKSNIKAEPLHFISSDGYDIYVGKNNYQNEDVTFRIANGGDLWFHAKNVPGSHVIVKLDPSRPVNDISELPDRLFSEAAGLAAYFSSQKSASRIEVDYTLRKNLKRAASGPPGFVIYHTNYSMLAEPKLLKQ